MVASGNKQARSTRSAIIVKKFRNLPGRSQEETLPVSKNHQTKVQALLEVFSRMRSEGFSFDLGVCR